MAPKPRPGRGFVVFKWLVYALLAANVGLYAWQGTATEAIDTAAWVTLLLLFERETGGYRPLGPRARTAIRALRALAALAVGGACIAYAAAREWLDFANATTWLVVVLALELEVRVGPHWRRFHRARAAFAWVLYAALAGYAATWLVQGAGHVDGAWLDAWDALLWLAAFAVIELNVFGFAARAPGPAH